MSFRYDITDEDIINASKNSRSAADAARSLNINFKTYKARAEKLGVYRTNQSLKGFSKPVPRKYDLDENTFKTLESEGAYWLGFIAADGSIVENTLRFVLKQEDEETLKRLLTYLKSNYIVHYHKSHYKDKTGIIHYFDACNLKITSSILVNTLKNYGIIQGKKYLDINFLSYIPDKYKMDFIIGFFDGDGSISSNSINMAANYSLIENISNILKDNYIFHSIGYRDKIGVIYLSSITDKIKFIDIYINKSKQYGVMRRKYNNAIEIKNKYVSRL